MNTEAVKRSYGRCLRQGDFFTRFYNLFYNNSSEVEAFPSVAEADKQKKMIRHGTNLLIMFAADETGGKLGLQRIKNRNSYSDTELSPILYPHWKDTFMKVVKEFDSSLTDEIKFQWEEVIDKGVRYVSGVYEVETV